MERNIQKNGQVNLAVALVVFLAGLGVTTFAGSLAGQAASIFLGLGIIVAGISWFQMRLEENERAEKLELDELASSRGASLFESKDGGSFPAQNARQQFEKFFVPGFTILLLLLEGAGAWFVWVWSGKTTGIINEAHATASLSLFAIFALLLFLLGRFSVTIARLENHRLLRPGASFLLAGAYVCALVALGIAGTELKFPHADFWMARGLCVLLGLMALENLLTLLLEMYRPRVKGKISRPLYESRVVGIFAQPESLFTTAAQTLDYQFGFKVSETWFFKAAQKNLAVLLLIQLAVLVVSTMFVFVDAGEQAVLEHFGKPVKTLTAGAHFKLPWPMDKVYRFRTEQIQSFAVGYTPDEQSESANTILWTVSHNKEENFLVANRATVTSATASSGTNDAAKAQTIGLITVSIPIQFQITNVTDWVYKNSEPDKLLEDLATREVIHYFAGVDLNDVLSQGRLQAADALRERLQNSANARSLGAKIVFVGLQDIHPPTASDVAATYEKVVGAEQTRLAKILDAEAAAIRTNALAEAAAFTATNVADARRITQISSAYARAGLFTNQIPAYKAAPSVYRQRLYLQSFAAATKGARKYVLLTTNTQDVIILNLEDKVRADLEFLNVTNTP
ncbi:MAG: hypothetical protein RL616_1176 [Verrucomicrobiota bacterium]|jgi:regulator of protease activity HflC (stomatin/prohibitin superfamily)